jgi:SAM-dependent methyltransferase
MADLYVQYGCGTTAPDGWINFDASPRLRLERLPGVRQAMGKRALFPANVRFGDIVAGLPVANSTAKGLFCSHVLEHIYREDIPGALRNSFKALKPGGIFRLVVPDLGWRIDDYIRTRGTAEATETLHHRLHLRPRTMAIGIEGRLRATFGLSLHQWMYDEPLMAQLLADAGFTDIRRATFGDCEDPAFAVVEEEHRFVDVGHAELAMECQKPLEDLSS